MTVLQMNTGKYCAVQLKLPKAEEDNVCLKVK